MVRRPPNEPTFGKNPSGQDSLRQPLIRKSGRIASAGRSFVEMVWVAPIRRQTSRCLWSRRLRLIRSRGGRGLPSCRRYRSEVLGDRRGRRFPRILCWSRMSAARQPRRAFISFGTCVMVLDSIVVRNHSNDQHVFRNQDPHEYRTEHRAHLHDA